jgi:phospholipid-translocating ATPase
MSQSPTEKRGEPGSTRPNIPNDTVTAVSSLRASAHDNAPSAAPNMASEEAPSGAAHHQENAGDARSGVMVEDDRSSHQHLREPPSPSLSTTSLVGDQRVADSPLAMRSLLPTESGPPSRGQSPPAKTRNRGHSLRRSLFSKKIQNQPASDGMTLEVESTDASSVPPKSTTTAGKSEKGHASVSVSTYAVDEDSSIPPGPTKYRNTWTNREVAYKRSPLLQPRQELLQKLRQWFQNRKRILLRTTETPPTADGRHINLGSSDLSIPIDERTGRPYVNNVIRSGRYTLLNFFPRQLLAQFSKLANFYFLTVSILQMIPGLSTTGTYTTIVPLLIFVGISMAKEGYDDIRRWRLDKEENNRDTLILDREWHCNSLDKTRWKSTKWHDVKVGDVLRLQRNDPIPADLVLLHVDSLSRVAYIEVCKYPCMAPETLINSLE